MHEVPKDVLKMASGLISPSGLAGHRRPLCNVTHNLTHNKIGIDTHSGVISSLNMFPVKRGLFSH